MRLWTKFFLIIIVFFVVLYSMSIVNFNGFVKGTEMSFSELLDIDSVTIISNSLVIVDSNGILYCLGAVDDNQIETVIITAKMINADVKYVTLFPIIIGLFFAVVILCIRPKKIKGNGILINESSDDNCANNQVDLEQKDGLFCAVLNLVFALILTVGLSLIVIEAFDNSKLHIDKYSEVDKTLTKDHYIISESEILFGIEIQFTSRVDISNAKILVEFLDKNKNVVSNEEIDILNLGENEKKQYKVTYELINSFSIKSYRVVVTGKIK